MNREFWNGRSVFLTGHTGFKGGWLAIWLADMGAKVHGFALAPSTDPSFFTVCNVEDRLASHVVGDIRDPESLRSAMANAAPDVVLHLAAQALVLDGYEAPAETYATNVMGTVNLLEAVRQTPTVRAVVNVTTDKCYENREWVYPYRECDSLGGHDPYSSSKACSELVTAAYRRSFLDAAGVQIASARAGNVIGGGDWSANRLIPDFLRALDAGSALTVRSPNSTRPWQHVLEPLSGYIELAESLVQSGGEFASAFNFGPEEIDARPVKWIVERLCAYTSSAPWKMDDQKQPHEAGVLKLDSSKAKTALGWRPAWGLAEALEKTVEWHLAWRKAENMTDVTLQQIHAYAAARAKQLS